MSLMAVNRKNVYLTCLTAVQFNRWMPKIFFTQEIDFDPEK